MITVEEREYKLKWQRKNRFKKKYGVYPEEHDKLIKSKGGNCRLCKGLPKDKCKVLDKLPYCEACYEIVKKAKSHPIIITNLYKLLINTEEV